MVMQFNRMALISAISLVSFLLTITASVGIAEAASPLDSNDRCGAVDFLSFHVPGGPRHDILSAFFHALLLFFGC